MCLLLFQNRGAVIEHVGEGTLCFHNIQRYPEMQLEVAQEFAGFDATARESLQEVWLS